MKIAAIEEKINIICRIILIIISLYYSYLILKSGILENGKIQELLVLLFLMIFEGLPFILIGSVIAAVINLYVSEKIILKIITGNVFSDIIKASFTGLFFPLCECGIVPVIKNLLHKKLPLHIAVTVMISVPIVNPVVILTTFLAFSDKTEIVFIRLFSGIVISILTGFIVYLKFRNTKEEEYLMDDVLHHDDNCPCHSCCTGKSEEGFIHNFFICIDHVIKEFYSMGRYYIAGSFIAAVIRTFIPETSVSLFTGNIIFSSLFMIITAYSLSVCSESDAFIARKFTGIFPDSSITGFLVFGPMCDLKNTIMLLILFKKSFVLFLISVVFVLCFLNSIILSMLI